MSQLPPSLDCRGFQTYGIFPGDLRVPHEGQLLPLLPPPLIQGDIPQKAFSSLRGYTDQQFLPEKIPKPNNAGVFFLNGLQCHGEILLPEAGMGAQPWESVPSGPTQELLVLQEN